MDSIDAFNVYALWRVSSLDAGAARSFRELHQYYGDYEDTEREFKIVADRSAKSIVNAMRIMGITDADQLYS